MLAPGIITTTVLRFNRSSPIVLLQLISGNSQSMPGFQVLLQSASSRAKGLLQSFSPVSLSSFFLSYLRFDCRFRSSLDRLSLRSDTTVVVVGIRLASQVSSAFGVICLLLFLISSANLLEIFDDRSYGYSDYKWSIKVIIIVQSVGVVVGSIAPTFRCFTTISYFNLSKKWSVNHVNMFRVEGQWTQRLQQWKHSHMHSHIPGRHCKKVFRIFKNVILNFCIALQIMAVVLCKIICLVPRFFLILLSYCWYFFKSFLKRFKTEQYASNWDARSDMKEYFRYVLQIEDEATLSERILRKTLNSITQHIHASEEKEPSNLLQILEKSTSFNGVVEFDNDRVPPLHSEETHSWSLAVVTLTAIALALPNIANTNFKSLLASIKEGLQFVKHIEEMLYVNGDLVKSRKAGRHVWTEIEVHNKWLQIDLQKQARNGKISKEVLRWLSDEAVKIVIHFKSCKKRSLSDSLHKFLVASSMYRISETILLHCNEQENWPNDEELFEWISTIIADLLLACFTNLPRVIKIKCHHDAIERREDSIRTAAKLLGKSKKILKILEACQLPNLNVESMAYIDKWNALSKSEIPNGASSNRTQPASSSSSESLIVAIE